MTNPTDKLKRKKELRRNSWAGEGALIELADSCQSIKSSSSSTSTTSRSSYLSKKSTPKLKPSFPHSFTKTYQELCEYYRILPMATVKNHLPRKVLDFLADRLKSKDWKPLIEALITDKELHTISIRSRYPRKVVRSTTTLEQITDAVKCPVIFTHFFLNGLLTSLNGCLSTSESLACLELVGIPLQSKYLSHLMEGIFNSKALQHLSLENCPLGDEGTEELCKTLNHLPRITTLNLSGCGITPIGTGYIASLIKAQKMHRFMETWQKSLRYQNPNLDAMWGIRRIILNSNPLLGDDGVKLLVDILEDDLWLKAIDLQKCGVGKDGAMQLISLLQCNCVIAIIDIRNNRNVPTNLVKEIMALLRNNNKERMSEYHWIDLGSTSSTSLTWMSSINKIQRDERMNTKPTNELKSSSLTTIQSTRNGYTPCKRSISQPLKGYYNDRHQV